MNYGKKLLVKRRRFQMFFLLCLLLLVINFYSDRQESSFNFNGSIISASTLHSEQQSQNYKPKISNLKQSKFLVGLTNCSCSRSGKEVNDHATFSENLRNSFKESTCSDAATLRGPEQKVISYSFYNPENTTDIQSEFFKKYLGMMHGRMNFIQHNMPGWVVRIYHNVSTEDSTSLNYLCNLYCSFDNLDICNVTHLPTLGNLYERQPIGRLWRFAVMGDPTVSVFLSRDTDSYILPREVVAVNEWLNTTKEFHIMRDHPNHLALMLAGLWGGRNLRLRELAELRNKIFSQPADYGKFFDQALLANYTFPFIKNSLHQHTSFTCKKFPQTLPFSTKREEGLYTGWGPFKIRPRSILLKKVCPLECRPIGHKDWKYC